jgi:hypothetical protein
MVVPSGSSISMTTVPEGAGVGELERRGATAPEIFTGLEFAAAAAALLLALRLFTTIISSGGGPTALFLGAGFAEPNNPNQLIL